MNYIKRITGCVFVLPLVCYSANATLQNGHVNQSATGKRVTLAPNSIAGEKRARDVSKGELLNQYLPKQITALKLLQRDLTTRMNREKKEDLKKAFTTACFLDSVNTLIQNTKVVLDSLTKEPAIAIGSAPALKQGLDSVIQSLESNNEPCDTLKDLQTRLNIITDGIFNPVLPMEDLPTD